MHTGKRLLGTYFRVAFFGQVSFQPASASSRLQHEVLLISLLIVLTCFCFHLILPLYHYYYYYYHNRYFKKHDQLQWRFTTSLIRLCSVSSCVKAAVSGAAAVLSSPAASVCGCAVSVAPTDTLQPLVFAASDPSNHQLPQLLSVAELCCMALSDIARRSVSA